MIYIFLYYIIFLYFFFFKLQDLSDDPVGITGLKNTGLKPPVGASSSLWEPLLELIKMYQELKLDNSV